MLIISHLLLPSYIILKGDDNIKNVIIRFLGPGVNDTYQAYVNVYDEYNNLIFKGYTYNSILEINLCFNKIYKIEAIFLNERIQKNIYINNNIYVIPFSTGFNISKSSFLLTDYYYDNLPIERGEIILWQK